MRIYVQSLEELFECLDDQTIFENTIRFSKVSRPLLDDNSMNPRTAVKFQVVIQVSAIVEAGNGREYLVELGLDCGKDYRDASKELTGSEEAERQKAQLMEYVSQRNLKILPGIISD